MITINSKVKDRLMKGVKKFQPILSKLKIADVNESDTVVIITDMLCEIFGYDKYANITSEFAVKKTFCDLAIKLDGKIQLLIECKAIGLDLKDDFARQATNYAANGGIEWVVLTNGRNWKIFKIIFSQPIEKELVYEFDMSSINVKKQSDLELLYYLSIEAFQKNKKATLEDLYSQKQTFNRFIIGQIILTDTVVSAIRKQLKKMASDLSSTNEEISHIISSEILKREILEGDESLEARKKIQKMERASAKIKKSPSIEKTVSNISPIDPI